MTPQTASGRWLLGIAASVVVLAIVAVVVTLVAGSRAPKPLPAGSPEAAVQDFIIALDKGEYDAAYSLLSYNLQAVCSAADFQRYVNQGQGAGFRVSLKSVDHIGSEVDVTVEVTSFSGNPPFDFSQNSYTSTFVMVGTANGWAIQQAPWPFSGCPYPIKEYPPTPTPSVPTPTPSATPTSTSS